MRKLLQPGPPPITQSAPVTKPEDLLAISEIQRSVWKGQSELEFTDKCTKLCLQSVLIVDPDNENLVTLYGIFGGLGIETVLCNSGFKAVSAF